MNLCQTARSFYYRKAKSSSAHTVLFIEWEEHLLKVEPTAERLIPSQYCDVFDACVDVFNCLERLSMSLFSHQALQWALCPWSNWFWDAWRVLSASSRLGLSGIPLGCVLSCSFRRQHLTSLHFLCETALTKPFRCSISQLL